MVWSQVAIVEFCHHVGTHSNLKSYGTAQSKRYLPLEFSFENLSNCHDVLVRFICTLCPCWSSWNMIELYETVETLRKTKVSCDIVTVTSEASSQNQWQTIPGQLLTWKEVWGERGKVRVEDEQTRHLNDHCKLVSHTERMESNSS